jgi:hypothetical protein
MLLLTFSEPRCKGFTAVAGEGCTGFATSEFGSSCGAGGGWREFKIAIVSLKSWYEKSIAIV